MRDSAELYDENVKLKQEVSLLKLRCNKYKTVAEGCRILLDSMEEIGIVRVGDQLESE